MTYNIKIHFLEITVFFNLFVDLICYRGSKMSVTSSVQDITRDQFLLPPQYNTTFMKNLHSSFESDVLWLISFIILPAAGLTRPKVRIQIIDGHIQCVESPFFSR
jgi:hypothetical protein